MRRAEIIKVKDGYVVKIIKEYTADTIKETYEIALENGIPLENIIYKLTPTQ